LHKLFIEWFAWKYVFYSSNMFGRERFFIRRGERKPPASAVGIANPLVSATTSFYGSR